MVEVFVAAYLSPENNNTRQLELWWWTYWKGIT